MGLPEIVKKIQDDGQKQIGAVTSETNKLVREIKETGKKEEDVLRKEHERKVENEITELRNRRLSEARVTQKKALLQSQSTILDAVFSQAEKVITELPQTEYCAFLQKGILSLKAKGAYTLLLNDTDRKSIGKKLVDGINNDKNSSLELTLGEKSRNISGGFILKGIDTEINASVGVLLGLIRREIEPQLGSLLFK